MRRAQRALISLTDKSGCEEFAGALAAMGIAILSTGGTARKLRDSGIEVTDVSTFTGFPELLDGRVKTLHPLVHGGILQQRRNEQHQEQCRQHGIQPIDIVVVNLYAFENAVASTDCTLEDAVEHIDIGGPAMLRASAKNFQDVTVVVDPADYPVVLAELQSQGNTMLPTRFRLARKAFALTAAYDTAIAQWLDSVDPVTNPYFIGA
ncbi:IMP cyclohydrolase [Desulfobulbus oligotrophicus]|jgi:phosphoribosylaminoimidazolecarboxamide formyltransferase/IMP cyclohydrolase|uniref:IMP cyclohydrolase n=1 Tax=Desulfobulbus oligotrophicus TaxID=1909699 RepID=A0A7T5VC37_9BACT|nr:IMP cyclohydrolase [Desulfobulbus oligotrophicus]MDY0390342.1 IMP cyclohydrolase [Desulfobulbus oligotrophicus]QQG65158.1 IMP cyclohydrolase [Desulfobulbus oligotrophicus]